MKRMDALFEAIGKFLSRLNFGGARGISVSGDWIGTVILLTALAVFLASIFWLWRRRMSGTADGESARAKLGTAARLADLPEGIGLGDGDPWAEAERRRAAGDLAGAVVCLFAHQLLCLDQLGLIRLVPGRTGRQYLQVLRDRELADSLGATLRLFEDVYYGRRRPTRRRSSRSGSAPCCFGNAGGCWVRERHDELSQNGPAAGRRGHGGDRPGCCWMLAGP